MSQLYMLTATVPHDDIGFPEVQKLVAGMSYTKKYWRAVAHPNRVEYVLGPYSQVGIDNAKAAFREAFKGATPEMKKECGFQQVPHTVPGTELS